MENALNSNAHDLERELDWFANVLDARLQAYFGSDARRKVHFALPAPSLDSSDSPYARFCREHDVSAEERLVLLLALIPHIRPQLLDVLLTRNDATNGRFSEFGGSTTASRGGFVPTGETAVFLLAGDELGARFATMRLFEPDALLIRHDVVRLSGVSEGESRLAGTLVLSNDFLQRFTSGDEVRPAFSTEFPARRIQTELEWSDLVLPETTVRQLDSILQWVRHGETLLDGWRMRSRLQPGYTSLFYGDPGTGKTLAASLLGKHCERDVYKVDLSLVVSKYIGETERNLSRVFDTAEHKGWILFFDEADALFGRRTRVSDSHDRYANQEISYLLQRIECFHGVTILASNFKANIDDAFVRRFQSVIHFPVPRPPERLRLWREAFSDRVRLDPRIDLAAVADRHEMTGGTIMNVVRFASLMAISRGDTVIAPDDFEEGVRREFLKDGRAM